MPRASHDGVMTSARAALLTALGLLAAAVVVALAVVPWDAAVAPWADLDLPSIDFFTSEQIAANTSYAQAVWLPALLATLAGPVAAAGILLIAPLRRWLVHLGPVRRPMLHAFTVGAVLLMITKLVALPAWIWASAVRRDAGILVAPWPAEIVRWLVETLTYVGLGALGVTLVLGVLRRWPQRGWIAVVAGAMVAAAVVSGLAPLLQRVEGASAGPVLTAQVMAIANELGVDVGGVSIIDTADRSPALNANVSGLGPTRTVTVYDTVAQTLPPAQVDALVAHELIHVRENDVLRGTVLAVLGAGAVMALAVALALRPGVQRRLGASSAGDVPMACLLVSVILVGALVGAVAGATISRQIEWRTDIEAVQATGDPAAYSDLMVMLAVTNRSTLEPDQWRYALFFTHPTPLQRLALLSGQ